MALATSFSLKVSEPQDESTVSVSPILVKGVAPLDATVSVNNDIVELGADGSFSVSVELDEGPNIIEVGASNYEGNEANLVLIVIYIP